MARMRRINLAVGVLAALCATAAGAGIPNLDLSTAATAAGGPASIVICPQGDADRLDNARGATGATGLDATVTLNLLDSNSDPIAAFPAVDMWLDATGISLCLDGSIADGATDINGQTTWTGALAAGGYAASGELHVMISGNPLNGPGMAVVVNSPDLNADLAVNLTDVVLFAGMFYGPYDETGDFYHDGALNLSDIVILAQHMGHECP